MSWKNLPFEGRKIKEIVLDGSGKRSTLSITTDSPETTCEMHCSAVRLELTLQGNWKNFIKSMDDRDVAHYFTPLEPMTLKLCSIEYGGSDQDFNDCLERLEDGDSDFMDWALHGIKILASPQA